MVEMCHNIRIKISITCIYVIYMLMIQFQEELKHPLHFSFFFSLYNSDEDSRPLSLIFSHASWSHPGLHLYPQSIYTYLSQLLEAKWQNLLNLFYWNWMTLCKKWQTFTWAHVMEATICHFIALSTTSLFMTQILIFATIVMVLYWKPH